jgi:xanthine dehydrogenase/oxidase
LNQEFYLQATKKACEKLVERLEPVKSALKNPSWEKLIEEAYKQGIDLCATYM